MFGVFFLLIVFFGINQSLFGVYLHKHAFFNKKKMNLLYLYHMAFYGVYSWYAYNNPSDSHRYFNELNVHEGSWLELFGTDTLFINFISFPFYHIGFNYDMLMVTFAWLGYLGFIYAYLFIREKIPLKIKVFKKFDLLTLILFFPNMHFWTASLGKGAPIFLGLMMFTYAIINPKGRILLLILSSIIIFYIRPHVFMFVAIGAVLGYMSGKEKISLRKKLLIFTVMIGALVVVQDQILAVMGLEQSDNLVEDFQSASEIRSEDLSDAGSGVNMSAYPLPIKLFTFWFRPLFIDAPNFLGIITSVENLIYLLLFVKILKKDFIKFIRNSPSVVKMSFVIFISASLAMTFVMSNLGIIMRQKTMVMYFIFFVIYYYLAEKKYKNYIRLKRLKEWKYRKLEQQQELLS
jgi:hypothetical protein